MNQQNLQHIKVAIASPQENGQVERYNRTILHMLAKLADERKIHWYNVFRDVEFACNNIVSKTTNEYSNILFFGVRQRGDTIDGLLDALKFSRQIETFRDLVDVCRRASEQIRKNQNVKERLYNRKQNCK